MEIENFPRTQAELESQFSSEQACGNICLKFAGRVDSVVSVVAWARLGLWLPDAGRAPVATITSRPLREQHFRIQGPRVRCERGWVGYLPLEANDYRHRITYLKYRAEQPWDLLPRIPRVFALLKRWRQLQWDALPTGEALCGIRM